MGPRISLALAFHNHQPVGNFGWVIAEVYDAAYEPMVAALERHPTVRLSLHYSGPLLEWLRAERPDFIERLGALVERGQVEILGRRLLRAGPRRPAGPRPDRPARAGWATSSRPCSGGGRAGRGSPNASGSHACRPRWSPAATTGRSSTTRTSGRRRSPRRALGRRTRPRTRAASCESSGPSRACATGSRSAASTRSSTTCATTPPKTASGSGRWATTARSSGRGRRPGSTAGARAAGSTASSRRSRPTPTG